MLLSGVHMSGAMIGASLALFGVSAIAEGAITVAVVGALEAIQPGFILQPSPRRSFALGAMALAAVLLATGGVLVASASPDGIEKLGHAQNLIATPLAGYQVAALGGGWAARASAGLAGLGLVYGACVLIGRKR